MSIILKTPSNGSVTLAEQDTASDVVVTVPAINGSFVTANSSGNVGIGVTPSAWGAGWAPIQFSGDVSVSRAGIARNAYYDGSAYRYIGTAAATLMAQSSGSFQWFTAPSGTAGNAISFTQAMTLSAGGNLTVGETTTDYRLNSQSGNTSTTRLSGKTLRVASNASGADVNINFTDATTYNAYIGMVGGNLYFDTGGTERARIDSGGNLLVGKQTTAVNGVGFQVSTDNSYTRVFLSKTFNGAVNGLLNYHNGAYVGGINYDNTSTTFPTSSDVRLKKDIVDAPSATQKIDNIRIVSHGWKHDDAVVEFGVIAQELVSVAPNAVMQGDDGEEVVTTWSVDYSKLVPLLIKAHQEQQAIIIEQQAALTQLQADVAALQGAA